MTCLDEANVFQGMVFFRQIFSEVATEFPDVRTEYVHVDATALFMVTRPLRHDVLVSENMFGDILSDLGAGTVGGLGVTPSATSATPTASFSPPTAPRPTSQGRASPTPSPRSSPPA